MKKWAIGKNIKARGKLVSKLFSRNYQADDELDIEFEEYTLSS